VRGVALLLLLALSGPTVVGALCDARCLRHQHHDALAVPADCHEHSSQGAGATLSSGITICHVEIEDVATIASVTQPAGNLALVDVAATILPAAPARAGLECATRVNPPDRLPISTPLRI
jgi:hypothetical protein